MVLRDEFLMSKKSEINEMRKIFYKCLGLINDSP